MNGFICRTINQMYILDRRFCVQIIVSFGIILLHIASSLDYLTSKRFQQFSKSMRKNEKNEYFQINMLYFSNSNDICHFLMFTLNCHNIQRKSNFKHGFSNVHSTVFEFIALFNQNIITV